MLSQIRALGHLEHLKCVLQPFFWYSTRGTSVHRRCTGPLADAPWFERVPTGGSDAEGLPVVEPRVRAWHTPMEVKAGSVDAALLGVSAASTA
eukprot:3029386-Prymnesium_polylepis.1